MVGPDQYVHRLKHGYLLKIDSQLSMCNIRSRLTKYLSEMHIFHHGVT